jgi:hypothetical protein
MQKCCVLFEVVSEFGAGVIQSVESDYGLDDRTIGIRSPAGQKIFL